MPDRPLSVAVVGHTNTGKTSLLRTLTRDTAFGEVSSRPAVTRHVEAATLNVNGVAQLTLYDTPGLEDSIGLLDAMESLRADRRDDGPTTIQKFLDSDLAEGTYAQEAKSLRQVIRSDVALYVIDARDRMLGKHRDELEILVRCARPVVPVLNFVANEGARTSEWRSHLSRVALHAVAEFDTVVFEASGEIMLFEKMRTLLDEHRAVFDRLIDDRRRMRRSLVRGSAHVVSELLIDVASLVLEVDNTDRESVGPAMDTLRETVRKREQAGVEALLELHQFDATDCDSGSVPLTDGRWGLDLFSTEALRGYGLRAGGGAAAGAMAGLAVDAMFGGLSLGAATVTGAAIGAVLGGGGKPGRRIVDRLRGRTELRADSATLRLLAIRQVALVDALLRRGHASQEQVRIDPQKIAEIAWSNLIAEQLKKARAHPNWSTIATRVDRPAIASLARSEVHEHLARALTQVVNRVSSKADGSQHSTGV